MLIGKRASFVKLKIVIGDNYLLLNMLEPGTIKITQAFKDDLEWVARYTRYEIFVDASDATPVQRYSMCGGAAEGRSQQEPRKIVQETIFLL